MTTEQDKSEKVHREEYQVSGEEVVGKIKELIHEGNIRRIILKNEEGRTLIEIPLTLGVVGAVLLPVWAAIGAIAALAANLTIVIEKVEPE
ncbi:MAG TPA: DUF4342 domain-containing protein [Anaerolineales bacterium]|jgi:hypothetical protein|nr:DUF4342 domain-containing protein [Anaerolineales bacterium]